MEKRYIEHHPRPAGRDRGSVAHRPSFASFCPAHPSPPAYHITSHHITPQLVTRSHPRSWVGCSERERTGTTGSSPQPRFLERPSIFVRHVGEPTVQSPLSSPRSAFNPAGGQSSSLSVLFPARALRVKAPARTHAPRERASHSLVIISYRTIISISAVPASTLHIVISRPAAHPRTLVARLPSSIFCTKSSRVCARRLPDR